MSKTLRYNITGQMGRGKTKIVHTTDHDGVVVLDNQPSITANDDPNVTREFAVKAMTSTTTTCRVFELLRNAGIPVAYIEQVSSTSFAAPACAMLPLEAVIRRHAVGSFLKRHPDMLPETTPPFRFRRLRTELFLKTTRGHCVLSDGMDRDLGLDPEKGEEDPLLIKGVDKWQLYHSKKPAWDKEAYLGSISLSDLQFDEVEIDRLSRRVFLVLESAWSQLGWRLIDIKIEFGITQNGRLVVADVVDNDSWRLRDQDWHEMSKQVFRDMIAGNEVDLDEVAWRYQMVASMTEQFRIPKQIIVIWKGSENDTADLTKLITEPSGVEIVGITLSGHRQTASVLEALPIIESGFPDGGVLIDCVGLSNGLGPILSAHTHWPVINVPMTPEDAMSSLRLPRRVPATTALNITNALHHALQILAAKNAAAYATVRVLANYAEVAAISALLQLPI